MRLYHIIVEYSDMQDKSYVKRGEKDILCEDIQRVIDTIAVKILFKDLYDISHIMTLSHLDYYEKNIGGIE